MSYIRTKNGVYEVIKNELGECIKIDGGFILLEDVKDKIIDQADTILELCDEFVLVDDVYNSHTFDRYLKELTMYKTFIAGGRGTIYGAIWTSKGLIYVAKMNENGELVLI